jgi:hypothetical protein
MPKGMTKKGKNFYHVTTSGPRIALMTWVWIEGQAPDPTVKTFEAIALIWLRCGFRPSAWSDKVINQLAKLNQLG